MRILGLALLAVMTAGCGDCAVDCAIGYEVIPGTCNCRPIPGYDAAPAPGNDAAPAGGPLASCVPGSLCADGSRCIEGCPHLQGFSPNPANGICGVSGRDGCGCGVVFDPCDTPGTSCLMPACCDYQGICVTPDERAAICARPEGSRFDCTTVDAGA